MLAPASRAATLSAGGPPIRAPPAALAVALAALAACGRTTPGRDERSTTGAATAAEPPAAVATSGAAAPPPAPPAARDRLTLLAGGDVSFGRLVGQMLLQEPAHDFFSGIGPWMRAADLRFANLEGPLSDQKGETVKPDQPLVFTGPPGGAQALARAGFSIVSTANNHAWDYGKPALLETLALLDAAGVRHAGTGPDRAASRRAEIVVRDGFRVAFLAVTDIWNDGPLARNPADTFVGRAEEDELTAAVRAARASGEADAVVVSYHGGVEYVDEPLARAQNILHAAIDAGADAVIGHHPHVVQGVEIYRGHPIFYSLGNLLFRMHSAHPWTGFGYLARVELARGAAPARMEVCPFFIHGVEIRPLAAEPQRGAMERQFFDHLAAISRPLGGVAIGAPGEDGCAPIEAAAGR